MNELWYEAELKRPPMIIIDVPGAKFAEKLYQSITAFMGSNCEDMEFSQTAALLSRLIARRKNSFHRMIGFRNLLKLNSINCRLLRADLPRDLEIFYGALPDIVCGENAIAALPTKNCLDYILVRLLSVYHIRRRIHDCTVIAAEYFLELIKANNFIDISTLLFAVLAKLRSLNANLGNKNIELYYNLLKYRNRFPMAKSKSLIPDTTELPNTLERFELPILETKEKSIQSLNAKKLISSPAIITINARKKKKCVDLGTEIERKPETGKRTQQQFQIENLKSVEDVKRFIATENKERKNSSKTCVTHRIPSHMWIGAQKIFERKVQAGDIKKALNVFLKFLSTNI